MAPVQSPAASLKCCYLPGNQRIAVLYRGADGLLARRNPTLVISYGVPPNNTPLLFWKSSRTEHNLGLSENWVSQNPNC